MQKDPQKTLQKFFLTGKKLVYKKGAVILRSDEFPSGVFYLHSGFIKDSSISSVGQEFTLFIFKPKDIFPYNWAFNKIPNEHSFTTMTDCIVFRVRRDDFLEFIDKNPEVLLMLMQKSLIRLNGVLRRLENMAFGNASKKIASIIVIMGERFGEKMPQGIKISLPIAHKDIAELVGITRETASIEIKKLQDMGIISRRSKSYIIKNKRLLLKLSSL